MAHRTSIRIVSVLSAFVFLLASCAFAPADQQWVKAGADAEDIEHEVGNCNALVAILWPLVWGKYCMRKHGFRLEPEVASP